MFAIGEPVTICHDKPWKPGRPIRFHGVVRTFDGNDLAIERRFARAGGQYDGLPARIETGDYGIVELRRDAWISRRHYFRASGDLFGELFNVQTPTQFRPGLVRYVDLEIDVAYVPTRPATVSVLDRAELGIAVAAGHIPKPIGALATALAEALAARLRVWDGHSVLDWEAGPDPEALTQDIERSLRRLTSAKRRYLR